MLLFVRLIFVALFFAQLEARRKGKRHKFECLLVHLHLLLLFTVDSPCNVLGRREWSAVPPKQVAYQKRPVEYVIVHHTGGLTCESKRSCAEVLENIQGYHMRTLEFSDIGYK